jgi:hypothetical protein
VINGELETVDLFTYLRRPVSSTGNDCQATMYTITKARRRLAMVSRILTWQGKTKSNGI